MNFDSFECACSPRDYKILGLALQAVSEGPFFQGLFYPASDFFLLFGMTQQHFSQMISHWPDALCADNIEQVRRRQDEALAKKSWHKFEPERIILSSLSCAFLMLIDEQQAPWHESKANHWGNHLSPSVQEVEEAYRRWAKDMKREFGWPPDRSIS